MTSNNTNQIANILYNMTLDIDYMDYTELWHKEIKILEKEIDVLHEKDSMLFHILETLAHENQDKYNKLTKVKREWNDIDIYDYNDDDDHSYWDDEIYND